MTEGAHLARARPGQADGKLQQRGLAGAVRADECREGARRDLERAVAQGPARAVALAEPVADECGRGDHATLIAAAGRTVSAKSAAIVSSSKPAARALSTHVPSDVRSASIRSGSSGGRLLETNVPWPRRPSTRPSRSSSRYALSTVFGLIARLATTSFTVGSWSPGCRIPRRSACLTCWTSCR